MRVILLGGCGQMGPRDVSFAPVFRQTTGSLDAGPFAARKGRRTFGLHREDIQVKLRGSAKIGRGLVEGLTLHRLSSRLQKTSIRREGKSRPTVGDAVQGNGGTIPFRQGRMEA